MKITSRASDYALLLLLHLSNLPEGKTTSVKNISEELNLSIRFLANIASKLSIGRILSTHRGVGGGIRLAKSAKEISVKDVIEAIDGPIQTMFCQNTTHACSHEVACTMKYFWDDLQFGVTEKLINTSIFDLANRNRGGCGPSLQNRGEVQEPTMV